LSKPTKLRSREDEKLHPSAWPQAIKKIRERTPARILVDRAGAGYTTGTQLELRQAHAAAVDAVRNELDLRRDFDPQFIDHWKLFEVCTSATSKSEYLLRPDLGRRLDAAACEQVRNRCVSGSDLQMAIGDGLSISAIRAQIPPLLPLLVQLAQELGWSIGQPFVIRHCRVGVMNHIGELLRPRVVVLLIGERPGLATAESLSAYMAYRPRPGHTDADRNLISNIHARGVLPGDAAHRILNLAQQMVGKQLSGAQIKEELPQALGLLVANPLPVTTND
jgi:ethanolamine ammonia-lyase small subunit